MTSPDYKAVLTDRFFHMLHREDTALAQAIGISLTADELRQVKERLILTWVVENLTGHEMLSVGDLLTNDRP